MRKTVAFCVLGLLPLWLSVVALAFTATTQSRGSEFWNVAPWLVFYGLLASGLTSISYLAASWTYRRYKGVGSLKLLIAAAVYLVGPALLSGPLWMKHIVRSEEVKVRDFALHDKSVAAAMDGPYSVFIVSRMKDRSHLMPVSYQIALKGSREIFAVIQVDRAVIGKPSFRLACTSPLSPGNWDSFKPLCGQ